MCVCTQVCECVLFNKGPFKSHSEPGIFLRKDAQNRKYPNQKSPAVFIHCVNKLRDIIFILLEWQCILQISIKSYNGADENCKLLTYLICMRVNVTSSKKLNTRVLALVMGESVYK